MRNRFNEMQLGECESICECIKDESNGKINLIIDEDKHGFILKNGNNELNSMLDLETLYQIILTFNLMYIVLRGIWLCQKWLFIT